MEEKIPKVTSQGGLTVVTDTDVDTFVARLQPDKPYTLRFEGVQFVGRAVDGELQWRNRPSRREGWFVKQLHHMFFTRVTVVSEWRLSESGDRYESVRFGVAGAPARLALDLPKVEGFSLKPLAAHLVMTSLVDGEGRYLHGSELPVRESGKVALQALSSVTKFPNPLLAYRFSLYAICRVAGVGVVTNFERPVVKTGEIIKYPTMKVLRAITTLDSWMRTTVSFKKDGEDRYTYIDLETPADYVRGAREAVEYLRRASQTTLADIRLESFGEDHQFHVDAKDAQDSSILLGKFDE